MQFTLFSLCPHILGDLTNLSIEISKYLLSDGSHYFGMISINNQIKIQIQIQMRFIKKGNLHGT